MKAVILAGGMGTRMYPLEQPKPLLTVGGKTILQHSLEQLEGLVEEAVVIVHYKKELMAEHLKKINSSLNVRVTEQPSPLGTFDALQQAKPLLGNRFLVMNGDDIYWRKDIESCLSHQACVLAKEVSDPTRFGILELEGNQLKRIMEKPTNPQSSLANTGLFVLEDKVFDVDVKKSDRGEFELTDAVSSLEGVDVVKAEQWLPIGYPWDLLHANELFLEAIEQKIEGTVEKGVTLKGPVVIGKNSIVKSGAYIEGPVVIGEECTIGPNCFIRGSTVIGNNSRVGNSVEIKNSVLGSNVYVCHLSYLGDSVLGNNINIGGGTIAANLRHDNANVMVPINGTLKDTKRRKFGCVIKDGVHTGVHTSIYPGRVLERNTLPGEVIK